MRGPIFRRMMASDRMKDVFSSPIENFAAVRDGRSRFISAADGLRLHVREYGQPSASALSVVCLPGLTRTTADFEALAPALAYGPPQRRVIALDSRGRGQSGYDPDAQRYNVAVELADLIAVLDAAKIQQAVFIGSSRGGILTMLLAATNPATIAGAVLHDIGPVIEQEGLRRIKDYVGKLPQPVSFTEGAEILRRLFEAQFPKLTNNQWLAASQRTWKIESDRLVPTYDIRLAEAFAQSHHGEPLPALWNEFDALAGVPVLVIRGANSDILSEATLSAMRARHPDLESVEVPDQGHVPFMDDPGIINRVAAFVGTCDEKVAPRRS
jgi:pimeloyl-ACP methyl ester carboxylesterase